MATDTVKGTIKAFAKKGVYLDHSARLLEIMDDEFETEQRITRIENEMWRFKNSKLKECQHIAALKKERNDIYIKLGKKVVRKEGENDE